MMKRRGRSARARRPSFKARVRRVLMSKAETKQYRFGEENVQLYHNFGRSSTFAPGITFASMNTFFNIWADIPKGTGSSARIGDKITPRGMSLKLWLANKLDRPFIQYRIIIARVPKAVNGVATTTTSISNPFDEQNLGNVGNKLLLPLDRDRGIKALYDRVVTIGQIAAVSGVYTKEQHIYKKLWFRNKKARDIVYDSTNSNQIVNNPVVMWIIPYEQYSTLETDNIASCAYYGTIYYKDI